MSFDPALILQSIRAQQSQQNSVSSRNMTAAHSKQESNVSNNYQPPIGSTQKAEQFSFFNQGIYHNRQDFVSLGGGPSNTKEDVNPGQGLVNLDIFNNKQSVRNSALNSEMPSAQKDEEDELPKYQQEIESLREQLQISRKNASQLQEVLKSQGAMVTHLEHENNALQEMLLKERNNQENMRNNLNLQIKSLQTELKTLKLQQKKASIEQKINATSQLTPNSNRNLKENASFEYSKLTDFSRYDKHSQSLRHSSRSPLRQSTNIRGKLELQKLVELYKEAPSMERPTIEIDFYL